MSKKGGQAEEAGEDPVYRGSLHVRDGAVTVSRVATIMNESGATAASVETAMRLPGTC